jgi:hypothetical protein
MGEKCHQPLTDLTGYAIIGVERMREISTLNNREFRKSQKNARGS